MISILAPRSGAATDDRNLPTSTNALTTEALLARIEALTGDETRAELSELRRRFVAQEEEERGLRQALARQGRALGRD